MDQNALRDLAEQKEREWRHIQDQRIEVLENTLKQRNQELADEKQKLTQLKEDFKYNLKLIEERDVELEKHEQALTCARKQLSEKNSEISELKIKLDEVKKVMESEKNAVDECKKFYVNRLNQKNTELEKYKSAKDLEINQERAEIEKYKRSLKMQMQDLQIELEQQRNELKTEFDEVMRKREHEWRMQSDEFNTSMLAKDLEIKMLKSELNQLREENQTFKAANIEADKLLKQADRAVKERDWAIKDVSSIKDSRIIELETRLAQTEQSAKQAFEELIRKHEELDKSLREKEMNVDNLKRSLNDEKTVRLNLEEQLAQYKAQLKLWNAGKFTANEEYEENCAKLRNEIDQLRKELHKQIELNAQQIVSKEINYESLKQDSERKLSEMDYLKSELSKSFERIKRLEQNKMDIELDWKRKYDYLESIKAQDTDLTNRKLTESRDQALAQVKSLEEKLAHKENVIKALQSADPLINLNELESNEVFKLREENDKLKQIVKQMREDIENLAMNDLIPVKQAPTRTIGQESSSQPTNEFVDDLQKQLLDLKQKNRQLQTQIDEYVLKHKSPEKLTDNTMINAHIKSLNETITKLRKEKVDLIAFCKKQQTKLIYIEKQLGQQSDDLRHRQTQIETLQYEMNSQSRRLNSEINNMKQVQANLELELSTTRREADEYHKATIEKNAEIASLESKISELKLKLSTSGTQLNFGAQELFIQQLQDEIKRVSGLNQQLQLKLNGQNHQSLREKQQKKESSETNSDNSEPIVEKKSSSKAQSANKLMSFLDKQAAASEFELKRQNDNLKIKLVTAAKFINKLIQEKEHLIEMSNQLRGELNRIKFENDNLSLMRMARENEHQALHHQRSASPFNNPPPPKSPAKTALESKLEHLEKKQYELTKKQLAFAQQRNITKSDPALFKGEYKSSNYKDNTSESISQVSFNDNDSMTTSSIKSENFREVWKILDENDSLLQSGQHINDLSISGKGLLDDAIKVTSYKSPETLAKPSPRNSSQSPNPSKKTVVIGAKSPARKPAPPSSARGGEPVKSQKLKIRNYNVRD